MLVSRFLNKILQIEDYAGYAPVEKYIGAYEVTF